MYAALDHVEKEPHASLKRQRSSDACLTEPLTKKARQLTPKAQEAQNKLDAFEKQLAKLAKHKMQKDYKQMPFLQIGVLMMIKNLGKPW
ncbi:MAG: hypothetical protein V6Z78_04930 [Holosporaceae bacterium]